MTDNGAGDTDSTVGLISFSGAIGAFQTNIAIGSSKPLIGSASAPHMDLFSVTITSPLAGGTLILSLTDTGFTGSGPAQFLTLVGGTLGIGASVGIESFINGATLTNLGQFGPGGAFSSTASGIANLSSPFSMGITATLVATANSAAQISSFDAEVKIPEPATLAIFGTGLVFLGFAVRRRRKVAISA